MDKISAHLSARTRFGLLATVLCALVPVVSQVQAADEQLLKEAEPTAIKLRDAALRGDSVAWEFVSELTTRIGPRPAGSAAEQAAAAWAAKKLKAYGFDDVKVEEFPITAWHRGLERGELIAPSSQPLSVAALGFSPPTPAQGIEGEVVVFQTMDELMAAPTGSLTGKIAMVNRRMVRSQDGGGYGPAVRSRAQGPNEASKRGAVAFVMRSSGTDNNRTPHTGAMQYLNGKMPIPAFALSAPDADQIERLLGYGEKVRLRLFSTASYQANSISQNVVADIRGSERPEEVIVLGAHLDSWELGTGAIDDGAGCAIVTAAAKLIGDLPAKPRRTIRVVLFGSEEIPQPVAKPLLGGRSYVKAHHAELAKHVITGESDFGADRVYGVALPPNAFDSPFGKSLIRVLTPIGVLASSDSSADAGTDVEPMVEEGVPSFILQQDGLHYFDLHHTSNDTLDKIDRAQFDQNVAAWVSLIYLAAQSDVDFRAVAASGEPKKQ